MECEFVGSVSLAAPHASGKAAGAQLMGTHRGRGVRSSAGGGHLITITTADIRFHSHNVDPSHKHETLSHSEG